MLRTWVINIALFAFLFGISFNSFTQSDSTSYSKNYVRVWPAINQISLEYERRLSPKHSVVLSGGYIYPISNGGYTYPIISNIVNAWIFVPGVLFEGIVSRAGWKRNFKLKDHHSFGLTVNALYKNLTHDGLSVRVSGGRTSDESIWESQTEVRNVYAVQCLAGYTLAKRHFTLEVFGGASIKYVVSHLTIYDKSEAKGGVFAVYNPPLHRTETTPSIGVNAGIKIGFGW